MIVEKEIEVPGPFGLVHKEMTKVGDAGEPVTEPTKVFRIEMPNGNGPYNSGGPDSHDIYLKLCLPPEYGGFDCARQAINNHENMNIIGTAFHDAHGHGNYGCLSLADLYKWFPLGARKYLKKFGAKIVEYEVPVGDYILKTQATEVIFNRYTAKKIAEHPLIEKGEKDAA